MPDISLPSHILFFVGPIGITNSLLSAFVVTIVITIGSFLASRCMGIIPTRFQAAMEPLFEYVFSQVETAFGSKERAKKFFPLFMSLMLFIAIANQFSLVPLIASVLYEGKPLLRTATSDLSLTIALALFVVVFAHVIAFSISPIRHIGNFIKIGAFFKVRTLGGFANALLEFALGLLDIVSEIAKVVSLSCRLFGNIFAGEVMVAVIASLTIWTTFIVPIPFIFLSLFSGFVQAFVFTLLSIQFIAGTIRGHLDTADERASRRQKLALSSPKT